MKHRHLIEGPDGQPVYVRLRHSDTIQFEGSNGFIRVDATSGDVLMATEGYKDIARVDLAERREWYAARDKGLPYPQPGGDILDVGYWVDGGAYEEAALDWREEYLLAK